MTTTVSSRPPPAPSTLSSAFFLSAEQNPFPLFCPPFLSHPTVYRMKAGEWKRGGGFGSRNMARPRAVWFDLSPSSLPPMVLADPGFACQKPKIPPLGIWCPHPEKSGAHQPLLYPCATLCPSQSTGRQMVWWSDPAVMDLCLGETGDRAGLPSHGQLQVKYLALNRCPRGRKKQ